jgi:hypothetical protein
MRHVRVLGMVWPERYFRVTRAKELLKRRTTPYSKLKLGRTNVGVPTRKSKWTLLFHKTYPNLKFDKNEISRKTGIKRSVLDTVYNKGLKAWKTSGSRPGATAAQWATARVYKFALISKKKAPKEWYFKKYDPDDYLRKRK